MILTHTKSDIVFKEDNVEYNVRRDSFLLKDILAVLQEVYAQYDMVETDCYSVLGGPRQARMVYAHIRVAEDEVELYFEEGNTLFKGSTRIKSLERLVSYIIERIL